MRAYVITTGMGFGLLTAAHVWRVFEEGTGLLRNPLWMLITLVSTALCIWACWLAWPGRRGRST